MNADGTTSAGASPDPPHPAGRRWLWHGLAILALVVTAGIIALGLPRQVGDNALPVRTEPVQVDVEQGPYGFLVNAPVTFDGQRVIERGEFVLGRQTWPVGLVNNANGNSGLPALPMLARPGVRVDVRAQHFAPPCRDADSAPPVLHMLTTLETGASQEYRFTVANPATYRSAYAAWCAAPVHASRLLVSHGKGGRATVTLQLANPQDAPVRVTSGALRYGDTRWRRASVVVPARHTARLTVHVTHYRPGEPTPWSRGLLTAGGVPIRLTG